MTKQPAYRPLDCDDMERSIQLCNGIEYLYTKEGQEIAAKNFYRPRDPEIAQKYKDVFPQLKLVTIDHDFGGWEKAQKDHFADGGSFDQIYHK